MWTRMLPMQVVLRQLALLGSVAFAILAGCSTLDKPKDRMASYRDEDDSEKSMFQQLRERVKELTGNGPNPNLARQLLDEAQPLYVQAVQSREENPDESQTQFLAAAEKFEEAAGRWPDSALEEEALRLLGECYYFADSYSKAEDAFGRLVKKYPRTRYLDSVQARRFSVAQYWLQLDDQQHVPWYIVNATERSRPLTDTFGHAMKIFDRIRLDDPTGKLADDATLALANAYFARGKFMKADEYYTDLRKTFPTSEHQFRAHFLGLKAKIESYQGLEYSGKPLEEADKLVTQIRKQFPVEAQAEREYLVKAFAEIRYRQAEREWYRAERHDRRAEYGAARMYYTALAKDFGDTPFGKQAGERLGIIADRPDVPPQTLTWLVKMFPERETVRPLLATETPTKRR
jgi:outer membrane protein assembly factor BamD (BamD/ComL family)